MAEEVKNPAQPGQNNPAPAASGANNNPAPAQSGGSTPQGGSPQTVPYERLQEVIKERNDLQEKLKAQQPTPPQPTGSDDAWKKKVDLQFATPDYLKDKIDDMVKTAMDNPKLSIEQIIRIHTPAEKIAEQVMNANDKSNLSRTGGTPNPAARQEPDIYAATDTPEVQRDKLRAELEKRIASGERV